MPTDTTCRAFLESIPWRRFAGAKYAFVAYPGPTGAQVLLGRLVLAVRKPSSSWATRFSRHGLAIVRGWLSGPECRAVARELPSGHVRLGNTVLELGDAERPEPVYWTSLELVPRRPERADWPMRVLRASGPELRRVMDRQVWDEWDRRLSAGPGLRFRGWADAGHHVHRREDLDHNQNCFLDLEVPIYARFAHAHVGLASAMLEVEVETHILRPAERLQLVTFPADGGTKPSVVPASRWVRRAADRWRAKIPLAPGATSVDLQLTCRGETVDWVRVGAPSRAALLHGALDPDATWLRDRLGLGRRTPDASGFEAGVAALLSLAGVPTVYYGFDAKPFPDLLAQLDPTTFLVGECTIRLVDSAKIEKLHDRVRKLQRAAGQLKPRTTVLAALFVPQSAADMPATMVREHARGLAVAVVGLEGLRELFDVAVRGEPREVLHAVLKRMTAPRTP